jgi:branched-chain amino acid transport system ATP-binding protein
MLEITNLGVRYGHHLALEGVSVKIAKGEICVILGANGAGKSSLLKAIAGMVGAEPGGTVVMNGKTITGMKAHKIVEEGIALVPEGRGIFGDLTVAENLQLGAFANRARGEQDATLRRIFELFPRLAERKRQIARTMSGGEQQMVAIGRALMSKPDILMLDEPSLGLSPLLTKELFRALRTIAQSGVGILLVEQNAKQSLKIADRGYLIENGLITGENTAAALASDPAVVNAYLGGGTAEKEKKPKAGGLSLPTGFSLPIGLGAVGRFAGAMAERAGAIQQAFVRFIRGHAPVPSAFVGRYDPAADRKAFETLSQDGAAQRYQASDREKTMSASPDARKIAGSASAFAESAAARLERHVRTQRLSSSRPSAFATARRSAPPQRQDEPVRPAAQSRPRAPEPSVDAAALADRAAARLADHMRRQRELRGGFSKPQREAVRDGAGAMEREDAWRPAPAQDRLLDAQALAEAAAERLASHLRQQRAARGFASLRPKAPSAPTAARTAAANVEDDRAPQPSPMLGHNSAGFAVDGEGNDSPASGNGLDYSDLAERAARRQAEFVAARRKSLSVFRFDPDRNTNTNH